MNRDGSAATAIIVIVIGILDDVGGTSERLLDAIVRVIGCTTAVTHVPHILVELVWVKICLIPHHLLEGLDRAHLPKSQLVLSSAPVHHQMGIVVEDNGRNDIIAAQISNEVNGCMSGYFPAMSTHRTTNVQGKQNSVVLDHWLLLLNSLRLHVHVVHSVEVLVGIERPVEHASIGPDSVEHLRDVCVGDVVVFSVDACCHHEIPQ